MGASLIFSKLLPPLLCILIHIRIPPSEVVQMAENPVAVENRINLAERHQIGRIKFEIGMEVKRTPVMYLKRFRPAANLTDRMQCKMLFAHRGPMARTSGAERMLAFRSIDEMFDDWHGRKRKNRPEAVGDV